MIAVKPIAEAIGVRWETQRLKILRDPRFSVATHKGGNSKDGKVYDMLCLPVKQLNGWLFQSTFRCVHMNIPSAGGPQEMLCLPARQLNGWLYGINANRESI